MKTRSFLLALPLALGALLVSASARSAPAPPESRLVAELIWGTNGQKPEGQELKPIPPDLKKRLSRIFKWQDYYGIERKEFVVTRAKAARIQLSKECVLEVHRLADGEFEILLFGKGVLVVTKRQQILPGETVVLGGDDKNDNAWFVVLGLAGPPPPATR